MALADIQPEHRFTSRRPRRAELLRRLYEAIDAAHSKLPEQQLGPTGMWPSLSSCFCSLTHCWYFRPRAGVLPTMADNHLDPLAHKKLHFSLAQLNANLRLFPEYNKFSLRWVVAPFVVLKGYVGGLRLMCCPALSSIPSLCGAGVQVTVAFVAQEESVSPVSQAAPLHVVRKKTVHAGDGWLYNGPAIEQVRVSLLPFSRLPFLTVFIVSSTSASLRLRQTRS